MLLDLLSTVFFNEPPSTEINTRRVDHLYQDRHESGVRFFLHYGDMTDSTSLIRLIDTVQPTEIYNLAAQSHVQVSFETTEYTANTAAKTGRATCRERVLQYVEISVVAV